MSVKYKIKYNVAVKSSVLNVGWLYTYLGGKADNLSTHLLMKQMRDILSGNEGEDNDKPKCHVCKSVRNIERLYIDSSVYVWNRHWRTFK